MKKFNLFRYAGLHLVMILVVSCCFQAVQSKNIFKKRRRNNAQSKPNILIVLADDVGTGDVPGYWGTGKVDMPNLKQFVDDGVVFTDAHSTPLCSPSRYVLLSGNYQHRGFLYTSTWKLNYQSSQFLPGQLSIADVLKANGYHTAMMGKWHIGAKIPTKSWYNPGNQFYVDEKDSILTKTRYDWTEILRHGPQDIGFDSSYVTTSGIQGAPYSFVRDGFMQSMSNITTWRKGTYNMPQGESIILERGEGSKSWDSTAYNMILVNETERFLDDHMENRSNDPFFAYVALGNVHIPHSPPNTFLDGTSVAGEYETPHMDILLEMDKVMGRLTKILRDRNMEDDTIVVFASDNGGLGRKYSFRYGHNSHGPFKGAKGSIYEGGHRIPLMMKWKNGNIPSGENRTNIIGLNDLYATLCDFAGVDIPPGQAMDSKSFANYIRDKSDQTDLREYLGAWTVRNGRIFEESIRKDKLKLIRNRHNGTVTLFDLETDLSESNSLISEQSFTSVVTEMLEKLEEISPCYDNEGLFSIQSDNGGTMDKTCRWFAEKKSRCEKYIEGRITCRLSCAGRSANSCVIVPPPPTRAPSMEPTESHSKTPSEQPTQLSTTTSSSPVCDDSEEFTFGSWEWQNSTRMRNCDWLTHGSNSTLTEQRISNWCNRTYDGSMVSDYCPYTCRICDFPSTMPSLQPTIKPSSSINPSAQSSENPSATPTNTPSITPSFISVVDCQDSIGFTFGLSPNKITRTCQWLTHAYNPLITDQRISKWCNRSVDGYLVQDYCRLSCGICNISSPPTGEDGATTD